MLPAPLVRAPPALSKIWASTNTLIEPLATRLGGKEGRLDERRTRRQGREEGRLAERPREKEKET